VIGSGIFLLPGGVLQQNGGHVSLALTVWFLGGILSLLGALAYGDGRHRLEHIHRAAWGASAGIMTNKRGWQIATTKFPAGLLFWFAAGIYSPLFSSPAAAEVTFVVTLPASQQGPITGRLIVVASKRTTLEPRLAFGFNGPPAFGIDVEDLKPGQTAVIDAKSDGYPFGLRALPPDDYEVQALLVRYTQARRADGHTIWVPLFDKKTGAINRDVVTYMRAKGYDLSAFARDHWTRLGPLLRGKIHMFAGEMDEFYLNLGVYKFQEMVTEVAGSDYPIRFEYGRPKKGHNWHHTDWAGVVREVAAYVRRIAPRGAIAQWNY